MIVDGDKVSIRYSQRKLSVLKGFFSPKEHQFVSCVIGSLKRHQRITTADAVSPFCISTSFPRSTPSNGYIETTSMTEYIKWHHLSSNSPPQSPFTPHIIHSNNYAQQTSCSPCIIKKNLVRENKFSHFSISTAKV